MRRAGIGNRRNRRAAERKLAGILAVGLLLGTALPGYAASVTAQDAGRMTSERAELRATPSDAAHGEENFRPETESDATKAQEEETVEKAEETTAQTEDTATPSAPQYPEGFDNDGKLPVYMTGNVSLGTPNPDGGVAEIVAFDKKSQTAFIVNGQEGVLNAVKLSADGELEEKASIDVAALLGDYDTDFSYGDMTSVAVDEKNGRLAVALQAEDYRENGRAALLSFDGELIDVFETGVQPDMITVSADGELILTANEGEPREGYAEGAEDPRGSVSIINTETGEVTDAGFAGFDAEKLAREGVLIGKVDGVMNAAERDLEPEYIALDEAAHKAYVTLQEANAIAELDLKTKKITSVKSAGFLDHGKKQNAADFNENGEYGQATYADEGVCGVRMPDGISLYKKGAKTYLLTANEGDAREWGEEDTDSYYLNEDKKKLTADNGTKTEKKVRVLKKELVAGLEADKVYTFGSRSFTIYDADTMQVVYDSGSAFEKLTEKYLPEYFNASNDNIDLDDRSAKKGPEPESVTVGKIGTHSYAFIALERIGGVMIYDITNPSNASYVNYINTRDFSEAIAGDVAPEGLCFISEEDSGTGEPYLLAACEVSGTLAAYRLGEEKAEQPATPSEPEKPATPSEPEKPATPSEPDEPKPSRPSGSGSGGGSGSVTGQGAYQPAALTGSWRGGNGEPWYFLKADGTKAENSWGLIAGKWYHFDQTGAMQTGWFAENGRHYYLGGDGAMLSGIWALISDKWYAFNLDGSRMENQWYAYNGGWYYLGGDGVMLTDGHTPDGYLVGSDGKWVK